MLVLFIVTLAGTLLVQMYLRNTYNRWGKGCQHGPPHRC